MTKSNSHQQAHLAEAAKPTIVVTRKHLWKQGTRDECLFIDFAIPALGLTFKNIKVTLRHRGRFKIATLIAHSTLGYHGELHLPVGQVTRYGCSFGADAEFEKHVFAALQQAPLTVSTARKTAPPENALRRLALAKKLGKVAFKATNVPFGKPVRDVVAIAGRCPVWRWAETSRSGYDRATLQFIFDKAEAETKMAAIGRYLRAGVPLTDAEYTALRIPIWQAQHKRRMAREKALGIWPWDREETI